MKKILMVVDYQNDFVDPQGALPVPNADKLTNNIQYRINSVEYDYRVYTFDTHTTKQYIGSDEQKIFPNIHCEYKTKGWDFYNIVPRNNKEFRKIIDKSDTPFGEIKFERDFFFTKDVFNIWDGNTTYPKWFESTFPKDKFEIDVVGIALNYCVFMNVMGMIEKGYKVNIIQDCVEGIKSFPNGAVDDSYNQNITVMKNRGVNFI